MLKIRTRTKNIRTSKELWPLAMHIAHIIRFDVKALKLCPNRNRFGMTHVILLNFQRFYKCVSNFNKHGQIRFNVNGQWCVECWWQRIVGTFLLHFFPRFHFIFRFLFIFWNVYTLIRAVDRQHKEIVFPLKKDTLTASPIMFVLYRDLSIFTWYLISYFSQHHS